VVMQVLLPAHTRRRRDPTGRPLNDLHLTIGEVL
jgi:hypothetical protein